MKLIYCPKCDDMVKLLRKKRRCTCGESWGWYKEDGRYAVVCGQAIPVGISNESLVREVNRYRLVERTGQLEAWVFDWGYERIERRE